jgi:plastocyanin
VSAWKMILVVAGSALALAACGGSADNSTGPAGGGCNASSASATAAATTVKIVSDPNTIGAFDPKTVSVKVGQAVEWDWQDASSSHTVTADDGSFDSGLCGQGTKFTHTFAAAGTVAYKCTIHSGMTATIQVSQRTPLEEAAPDAASSTAPVELAMMRGVRRCGVAATSLVLAACGATPKPDDARIVADYQQHRSQVEVTADGTVERILADQGGTSGPHERFIIRLSSGTLTLLIDHNLAIAPRAPVAIGDHVVVHGEYIWNAQGGLVHFTHHDPQGTHEGGFIEDNGRRYE